MGPPLASFGSGLLLSSVAIIHPRDLQKELFTDSGAGTLICRRDKIQRVSSVNEIGDISKVKETLARDRQGLDAEATVERFVDHLKEKSFNAYYDDGMQYLSSTSLRTSQQRKITLAWFFEKADGTFNKNGNVLFYYGCDLRSEALVPIYE
ncbi:acetylglutamate kinase n-acetyl-gamma-glutamyl-phosphate reductase precursor (ARG-6) [Fusarium sp. NRRL 52700]|nr:acetylglutamate kinase n-acetyl-gamma-glutamyl-phosphate reductase precursor (ARG-6) [Fusarium sp. NRRL 52700]